MSLHARQAGAAIVAVALLVAPALWNGFPLLQHDTGGYFARWYEGTLEASRSTVYGLFLVALARPDFWPAAWVQAVLAAWVLALTLRLHASAGRTSGLVPTISILSVATALPWLASLLLTDLFAGVAVLALHLVVFRWDGLRRSERMGLILLLAFAAATHSATLAVLIALMAAGGLAALLQLAPWAGLARAAGALALSAALLVAANAVVAGRLAWTPGGIALAFGRMLQDGLVERYLAERCPDASLRLCAHRHELPRDADVFFWGESVFDRLGRFAGLGDEMHRIVIESLRAYPAAQARAAAAAAARQLVLVSTGEGVVNSIWHTYAMIEQFAAPAVPAMRTARQQQGGLDFSTINRIHVPVALGAMLALPFIVALGLWRKVDAAAARLAATAALALLANAAVCGILSNPHDRYGARLAWIAPFVVLLVLRSSVAPRSRPNG